MKLIVVILLTLTFNSYAEFTHESELSTISAGGNTSVETYLGRTTNQFVSDQNTVRFGGHYTYGEAQENVSARDWDVNGKYEKMLSPRTAYIIGELIEGYKFQGIKVRYNSDVGFKYYYIKSDNKNFFSEIGYRYVVEDRYDPGVNQFEHKGRLYNELNHKPSETFQYKLALEYLPNFTNSSDYIVNGEASITSIMTSIFSLKLAYRGSYDDQPAVRGNVNYDYTYSTSLLAKF